MSKTINLDRSYPLNISYPIGVTESVTWTNNDEVTLTDTYEIILSYQNNTEFETIAEGGALTKVDNKLIWVVDYEWGAIGVQTYDYEVRNLTQDWREFNGTFTVTKTLK